MEISVSPLRAFPGGKGFGFNAVILSEGLWIQLNGFRIFTTGFVAPAIRYGRGRYYSAALLPKDVALKIVKTVLQANESLEGYLNPGLTIEEAVAGLVGDNATIMKFSIPVTLQNAAPDGV